MNQMSVAGHPGHEIRLPARVSAVLEGIRARWEMWSAWRRRRAQLLSLSDAALKDMGISRAQALFEYTEYSKPVRRD